MIRTHVSFTDEQMRRLRDAAARRGVWMAALVREAVDATLDADPEDRRQRWALTLEAVGAHRSVGDDSVPIAREHDAYLAAPMVWGVCVIATRGCRRCA